jgi:hypothetical protein
MIFGQDRDELRRMYRESWRKFRAGVVLAPLEMQIAAVIEEHPEYQYLMDDTSTETEFLPERGQSNPYLHMGLHLAIRDQLATNRPAGIRQIFERLAVTATDSHAAEHAMLECLAESLWEAQRNNAMPDETAYLERLRKLSRQ